MGGSIVHRESVVELAGVKSVSYTVKGSHPIYKDMANEYGYTERRIHGRTRRYSKYEQTGMDSEDELDFGTDF